MRFSVKSLLAAAVLGLSGLATPAGAQDARLVSYEELLDRVARLEQEMAETPPAPAAPAAPADEITDDGGLYVLYENVFVTPYFSQNTAAFIAGTATAPTQVRQFNWDIEYSPRIEIGNIDACTGTGYRFRYWHFDHSQAQSYTSAAGVGTITIAPDSLTDAFLTTGAAGNGNTARAEHSLRMSVADLEFLRRDLSAEGGFAASVGLRYARMDQWLRGQIINQAGAVLGRNALHHSFEGIGPTVAAEYVKRFDCSYWGTFINARGSLLYGESDYDYGVRNAAGALIASGLNVNEQDLLGVVEMQIGLDYRRPTRSCHEMFLRVALEAQYWHNAGSASGDTNGGGNDGAGNGNAQDADLGFLGVTVGTGLDW